MKTGSLSLLCPTFGGEPLQLDCDDDSAEIQLLLVLVVCSSSILSSCHAQNDRHLASFLPTEPTNTAPNDGIFGLIACFGIHPFASTDSFCFKLYECNNN